MLNRVDVSLILFESCLINTHSGEYRELDQEDSNLSPESIAQAAKLLLPKSSEPPSILLFLPTIEFVPTSYAMAVIGEKMVRSALELQASSLVPGYENELLMGVNGRQSKGVALWFPVMKANHYFAAFNAEGLFLSAIMPRTLAYLEREDVALDSIIQDEDATHCVQLHWSNGAIKNLLSINRKDLDQIEFKQQWLDATAVMSAVSEHRSSQLEDWTCLRKQLTGQENYCFFPKGSELASQQSESGKKNKIIAAVSIAAMLLLCMPFISIWIEVKSLEKDLAEYQLLSQEAQRLELSILDMEEEWGALSEYPDQQIANTLILLNSVIQSSLTSFEANKGLINIQGSTDDPAFLVEQLSEMEEFYNVEQSRSTTGGTFGFRMSLSNVDFEKYESDYPLLNE